MSTHNAHHATRHEFTPLGTMTPQGLARELALGTVATLAANVAHEFDQRIDVKRSGVTWHLDCRWCKRSIIVLPGGAVSGSATINVTCRG